MSVAQWEREVIVERTREAMAHKKANGEKLGGDRPYGFTVAADGKTLLPDAAEQRLIASIRAARTRGLSQRALVAELTRQGFTTRKGTAFSLVQVQRIMQQAQIA
jgi:DNA invertase Pin-like site-specific DNA recombinase